MKDSFDPFESLYDGNDARDAAIFRPIAEFYRPPARFKHGVETQVAYIPRSNADGSDCAISETRLPARCFRLDVIDSVNSIGQKKKGFAITTGSGDEVGALVVRLALAFREGMVGFHPHPSYDRLVEVLRSIEMETRKGGQWTPAEINEAALGALAALG